MRDYHIVNFRDTDPRNTVIIPDKIEGKNLYEKDGLLDRIAIDLMDDDRPLVDDVLFYFRNTKHFELLHFEGEFFTEKFGERKITKDKVNSHIPDICEGICMQHDQYEKGK